MYSSFNQKLIDKLTNLSIELDDKLVLTSLLILEYFYGNFNKIWKQIKEDFPIKNLISNAYPYPKNQIKINSIENIFNLYEFEGFVLEHIQIQLYNDIDVDVSSLFVLGEYNMARKLKDRRRAEKNSFIFDLLLNIKEINIRELEKHIKELYKTEFISRIQSIYTLIKADKTKVKYKDIKKLVFVNPFTEGLKLLMFAIKDEGADSKSLYVDAIERLYHIKYYYVEAILIYSQYLKDTNDEDYIEWFEKGKELAEKHHYRYLEHQFNCLDSGVYTEYNENNYPLPEPLDYSGIIKKYELDV